MPLSKEVILDYLKSDGVELFKLADTVREQNVGNAVHLRGLLEFSNHCSKNCLYCGLRLDNQNIQRYSLKKDDILHYVKNGVELGLKTIVLQSGEGNYYSDKEMVQIISEIKKHNVALTLSIGEKNKNSYKMYKEAGADRFLLRIETTDKELYEKNHPKSSWEKRKECLLNLKDLGYEVGTGCLVGLPNQSIETLADDILFFKDIQADMVGVGPFIPNTNTPLKDAPFGDFMLALKVMALTRIILPKVNIPATTAMETTHKNGRILALRSGANVVMPNIVEYEINKNYQIYDNKVSNICGVKETLDEIKEKIYSIKRIIA